MSSFVTSILVVGPVVRGLENDDRQYHDNGKQHPALSAGITHFIVEECVFIQHVAVQVGGAQGAAAGDEQRAQTAKRKNGLDFSSP